MSALLRHLALVSESATVGIGDVMKVAAALQKAGDPGPRSDLASQRHRRRLREA